MANSHSNELFEYVHVHYLKIVDVCLFGKNQLDLKNLFKIYMQNVRQIITVLIAVKICIYLRDKSIIMDLSGCVCGIII